ncbi:hypothetical protein H4S00_004551 [Coemansia sp. D1744]|nr:hypothetical protein H4S00_004551 [Coemansia sp. D1744]
MNHTTPKRFESRDFYQRPGQHSTSAEKEKKSLDKRSQFFTNLTSVNIATAFARAHITSDTIRRRPAHLKGTPMSPSQIPRMNLTDIPDEHDPHAHFESSAAPRPHGVRPVRNITAKGASRYGMPVYEQMDIDTPGYTGDSHANAGLTGGFLRERNWDAPTAAAPGWLRRIQDQRQTELLEESPPPNLVNTPSHAISRASAAPSFEPLTNNLIDARTPHPEPNGGNSVYARNGSGHAYTNTATVEKGGRPGRTVLTAVDYNGDTTSDMPGTLNRYSRLRDTGRTAARKENGTNGYGSAASQVDYDIDPQPVATDYSHKGAGRTPRAQSHYSLRSHVSTPGRLSYDHDFNPRESGHDQYARRTSDAASRKSVPVPTPYTARIKGPGAFPGTAHRFSQRRPGARGASDDDEYLSPTEARRSGARTASGNMALTDADLLTNHRYLSHGGTSHRGWGEYTQNNDAAERETVRSFTDSFISNSTTGGENNGNGEFERDNPTLLKRLLRNIAAGWSGSSGSFAERVSFVFFMIYFLIKETFLVLGTFLVRLAFNFVIGPVYTGVREVVMLPASLWRVLTPGSSHDVAGSIKGVLTGLSMVALSIVAAQYGQSVFSGMGSLPKSILAGGWKSRSPVSITPPAYLEPLTEDEIERLGGQGSAVVDRLINVEQTLTHLYGLLDTLKTHREDETQDVRESLKKLQQERQALLDAKRNEQQRIDNLEREYSGMKRDLKANAVKSSESTKFAKELQSLQKHVDKLAKSGGRGKGSGPNLDEVRRLISSAIKAQETQLASMLKPEWLTSDGDAAYSNVARMIEDALNRYANDRLGKTDFALFSAGSRIIPDLTSPTFEPPARGLAQKLWRRMGMISSHPPATLLDPDTHVGECWPMRGSTGQVAIHLAQPVDASDFALEHIARSIAIDWRSAPRSVEVWGYVLDGQEFASRQTFTDSKPEPVSEPEEPLSAESDAFDQPPLTAEPDAFGQPPIVSLKLSGKYAGVSPEKPESADHSVHSGIVNPPFADSKTKYGVGRLVRLAVHEYAPSDSAALQIIRPAADANGANADGTIRVRTIILKINSNWGHSDHTCLYRFRVHGHPADASQNEP